MDARIFQRLIDLMGLIGLVGVLSGCGVMPSASYDIDSKGNKIIKYCPRGKECKVVATLTGEAAKVEVLELPTIDSPTSKNFAIAAAAVAGVVAIVENQNHLEADTFFIRAAKDKNKIEAYPPGETRSFVREYLAHSKTRKEERVLSASVAEVEYLNDYATKKLGPHDEDTLAVTNFLAVLYRDENAFDKAEPLFQQVLQEREKVADLGTAEALVQKVLQRREKAADLGTAETLVELAGLYRLTGADDKAVPLLVRALDIRTKKLGATHPDTATSMSELASLYMAKRDYVKAEPLLAQAQKVFAGRQKAIIKEACDVRLGDVLHNLGVLYRATAQYDNADVMYSLALDCYVMNSGGDPQIKEIEFAYPDALKAGVIRSPTTTFEVSILKSGEKIKEKKHKEPQGELGKTRSFLGLLGLLGLGGKHEDRKYESQRWASAARDLVELHVHGHGWMAWTQPVLEEYLANALMIHQSTLGNEHPETAKTLSLMAEVVWNKGDKVAAREHMTRSLDIQEASTARQVLFGSDASRRQYLATRSLDAETNFALRDGSPEGRAIGAAAVLQVKGRALDASADAFGRMRDQLDGRDRSLMDRLDKIITQRSALQMATLSQPDSDVTRKRLDDLRKEQDQIETDLTSRSTRFQRVSRPVTLQKVQQTIASTDVLIEWIQFRPQVSGAGHEANSDAPRYAAYLIFRSADPELIDLGPATEVDALVNRWRQALRDPATNAYSDEARQLYQRIGQPLIERLVKLNIRPTRLLLSPDGALNLVPLAALVDGQGQYLGDRYELVYLSSGRDLLRMAEPRVPARDQFTVVAAPDYGTPTERATLPKDAPARSTRTANLDRSGMHFNALPGTAKEARLIKSLFKLDDQQVLTASAASTARVKQLHGPAVLHIATHGFFLPGQGLAPARASSSGSRGTVEEDDTPSPSADGRSVAAGSVDDALLRSGLALAGANSGNAEGGEDGILSAAEVARLDLIGTKLVVLSACETGSGEIDSREGVYGLRRAIELAGAESQLVSLWKVNDEATSKLMELYYERLKTGDGRAQALRSAQQALRKSPQTAHPVFWAAFIPIGDWRPLNIQGDAKSETTTSAVLASSQTVADDDLANTWVLQPGAHGMKMLMTLKRQQGGAFQCKIQSTRRDGTQAEQSCDMTRRPGNRLIIQARAEHSSPGDSISDRLNLTLRDGEMSGDLNQDTEVTFLREDVHTARGRADAERQTAATATVAAIEAGMVGLPADNLMMGRTEVTQGQWKAVMGNNPSGFNTCGDNCPVEQVSWDDIQEFLKKLNSLTGKNYRLPTLAEWNYACNAGEKHKFCGSDHLGEVAWYEGNSEGKTHPVGQKKANAWGLFDMSGNVEEWTFETAKASKLSKPSGSGCTGDGECLRRVVSGGSWSTFESKLLSLFISGLYAPSEYVRLDTNGLRLARTAAP